LDEKSGTTQILDEKVVGSFWMEKVVGSFWMEKVVG
jgi:hypothetical protein